MSFSEAIRKKLALGVAAAASLFGAATVSPAQTATPVPVPTWRYDLTHSGANTQETLLTPSNVNPSTFGKLFYQKVDSTVYPQPLYIPGLKMSDGLVHNVLFVATSNDSVYAFDADSNGGANAKPLWQVTMLDAAHGAGAGATAIPWQDTTSPDVAPTVGITGTPVIDQATKTMYLVANTKENGNYFSRLHAINILTGAEQANSPVNITATVPGTGNGSANGQMTFSPLIQNQRPALAFYKGYVYFGYAAHGDSGKWHGWLFGYDGTSLQQTMAMCLTPNGAGAGIWGTGAGFPIDTNAGKMYIVTGNGTHVTKQPFTATSEFGESVIAFSIGNGVLTPVDVFTPYNAQELEAHDLDLGAGGLLMLPDQQGSTPHMLLAAGKEGGITTLNRDNLGGDQTGYSSDVAAIQYFPTTPNDLSDASKKKPCTTGWPILEGCGFWSTASYWNGHVYLWPSQNYPMMFDMNSGMMDTQPTSMGKVLSLFPDPTFTVSANGDQDGIAWAVRSDGFGPGGTPGVLYAWNATDLTTPIYESDTNATRDSAGKPANKFAVPVVTNGKVYVVTEGQITVYGLLNGVTAAAAPTFNPNGGNNFTTAQTVTLASATPSAEIFYTLDGSTPTTASSEYTGPITVSTDTTVKAIASAAGYLQSPVSTATFNFTNQVPVITVTPPAGTYLTAQDVTLTDADVNAKIYYTTDGSTPTAASTLYTGAIHVGASETLTAVAIDPALANSNLAGGSYVIQNGGRSINFVNGFSNVAGLTLNGAAGANNDTRLQLTDGGLNEASSVFWNAPINIQAFSTSFEFQLSNAEDGGNGFTFTIQNNSPTALGGGSAGLGYQDIPNSVAVKFNFYNYQGEGSDSTGLYVNGQAPVNPTVDISGSGIQLNSDDNITATLGYDGTTLKLNLQDMITGQQFNYSWLIDIPGTIKSKTAYVGFTGGTGGLSSSQKLLTWTYVTQAVPPAFNPPAGSYTNAQNVTLTSGTSDAKVYYTTDGTNPTGNSTVYSGPIAVKATETINAVAISPTVGSSAVIPGIYTIGAAGQTGTFSLNGSAIAQFQASGQGASTITVTPQNGFTGTVNLTCAVTGPAGVTDLPTCSVTPPATITGTQAVTSQLTVSTDANVPTNTYTATVTGTSGTLTQKATVSFMVTGSVTATPAFALSGTSVTATAGTAATSTVTVTPSGGFTGQVTLACKVTSSPAGTTDLPTCSVAQPGSISGAQPVTATVTVNSDANVPAGAYKATVTGTSGQLSATTAVDITINQPTANPNFTMSGTAVTVAAVGTPATSTITITPSGGFSGQVNLTCAVTSSPAGANAPPTCSVAQPAAISGGKAVTATLTVNTTAASTAALHNPMKLFTVGGGGTLTALLLFCFPVRRRKWQAFFGLLLLGVLMTAASGCGGSTTTSSTKGGTTAGAYTITVTGTSNSLTATAPVTVTVQ